MNPVERNVYEQSIRTLDKEQKAALEEVIKVLSKHGLSVYSTETVLDTVRVALRFHSKVQSI